MSNQNWLPPLTLFCTMLVFLKIIFLYWHDKKIRQSIIYYARMLVRLYKWTNNQSSDVPRLIFFFTISCKILCKNCFNLIFYFFNKFTKIKSCECQKSIRNYIKTIILGTSDAWSMSHLSRRTSKLAYYIVDCRISRMSLVWWAI